MMENELESDEMMDVTEKGGQKERQVSLFNYIWFNLWQGLRKKREKVEEDPNPMELRPRFLIINRPTWPMMIITTKSSGSHPAQ